MKLVPPSARHRDSFLRAADAFAREGLPWWQGPRLELARRDFDAFVREKLAEAERGTPARPPKTHRWAIVQDVFVGRIAVFHHLTDALRRVGGHIGYDTHPEHRGRGYATQMLGQMLPVARTLGLQRVLLTCDASNLASVTVIERNGGVRAVSDHPSAKLRFWIALDGSSGAQASTKM